MPRIKINIDNYKLKVENLYENKYTILSKSLNSIGDKIDIYHVDCGNTFNIIANEFTRTSNQKKFLKTCLICRKKGLSIEKINNKLSEISSNRLILLDKPKALHSKVKVQCTICTNIWDCNLHSLFQNSKLWVNDSFGCPFCSQKRHTTETFKTLVREKFNNKLEIKSKYINSYSDIKVKCNLCNSMFTTNPGYLLNASQCKICFRLLRESKAIRQIKNILAKLNISYEQEITFEECFFKKELPFDFVITLNNKYYIIEYDGEQHYRGWNGSKSSLQIIQKRDFIKTEYCKNNNIKLLRLNYLQTAKEMEESINKFIVPYVKKT